MYIQQLYTSCLAEAAYYIESEGEAVIIDPLREIEPYLGLAAERKATIKFIFETHFHADFVSGHIDLSQATGAPIVYGPLAETSYEVYNAKDEEIFSFGKLSLQALHTPGHTPESTCYLLFDENNKQHAVFTGDTLFVGDVGRPDLLDGVMTKEELAGMLFDSLNRKIKPLPDDVIVYPAHGPGSACGKNIGAETWSSIGMQKRTNYALKAPDKETFIKQVTEGMLPPPMYFFEDARINKEGYSPLKEVIGKGMTPLTAEDIRANHHDHVVLDTRDPDSFEAGHIPGSINVGLGGQYAVWIGTLFPIDQKFVLVTEAGKEEESILRLARVGFEHVTGYLKDGINSWDQPLTTMEGINPGDWMNTQSPETIILDVRKPGEYQDGHVEGAVSHPLANLNEFVMDKNATYHVYCAGGYRSMIACSLLKSKGYKRVVNIRQGYKAFEEAGVPVVKEVIL
jgi:glyoxylase-like metal-dependent hydrolase (beta-lactamase superfamily II)/rhodanese-related sulfurtransferase